MRTLTAAAVALLFCAGPAAAGNQQACQNLANTMQQEKNEIASLSKAMAENLAAMPPLMLKMLQAKTQAEKDAITGEINVLNALNKALQDKIKVLQGLLDANEALSKALHCP